MNSDFYTYRYLIVKGSCRATIFQDCRLWPSSQHGKKRWDVTPSSVDRDSWALSEFGPQSIIYHEGSTYRVRRAILGLPG